MLLRFFKISGTIFKNFYEFARRATNLKFFRDVSTRLGLGILAGKKEILAHLYCALHSRESVEAGQKITFTEITLSEQQIFKNKKFFHTSSKFFQIFKKKVAKKLNGARF